MVKIRSRCSTCGKPRPPSTWAYCSKACERARRGRDRVASGDTDAWLIRFTAERLRLDDLRRQAMPWDRAAIEAQIVRLDAEEAAMRESLTPQTANRSSLDYWAPILRRECDSFEVALRRSLAVGIRLGARLVEAKAALPHGEFGRLFCDHDDAVPSALPFTRRWGSNLMAMAQNGAIVNGKHASHLPADLETVAVLARIPSEALEAAIQAGSVSPAMRRGDARRLLTGDSEPSEPEPADLVAELLGPINARLVRFAADHPELLQEAATRLKGMLRGIARAAAGPEAS